MALQTLPVLSHPDFPQVFSASLDRFTADVNRIFERSLLPDCSFEFPESHAGACDGMPCCEKATVSEISGDHSFCEKHFRDVSR